MTAPIQRVSDPNDAGGIITSTIQSTVFANSLLVAVNGSVGSSHPPCPQGGVHCEMAWITQGGSPNVFISGISVNRLGDMDSCSHVRIAGSQDIFVG